MKKKYLIIILISSFATAFSEFKISPLKPEQIKLMKEYKVISKNLPVDIHNLRMLNINYYNFEGKVKNGQLVVHATIAHALIDIFKDLLTIKFPINNIELIEQLFIKNKADVANNITISFYDREIKHVGIYHRHDKVYASKSSPKSLIANIIKLFKSPYNNDKSYMLNDDIEMQSMYTKIDTPLKSLHAYGFAIDINPIQNPILYFIAANQIQLTQLSKSLNKNSNMQFDQGLARYFPRQGIRYANRKQNRHGLKNRAGMVENIVETFAKHGMNDWGGDWDMPIDHMHFQVPRERALILEEITNTESLDNAIEYFNITRDYYNLHKKQIDSTFVIPEKFSGSLLELYRKDPKSFYSQLRLLKQNDNI